MGFRFTKPSVKIATDFKRLPAYQKREALCTAVSKPTTVEPLARLLTEENKIYLRAQGFQLLL